MEPERRWPLLVLRPGNTSRGQRQWTRRREKKSGMERLLQAMNHQCSLFAPGAHPSPENWVLLTFGGKPQQITADKEEKLTRSRLHPQNLLTLHRNYHFSHNFSFFSDNFFY